MAASRRCCSIRSISSRSIASAWSRRRPRRTWPERLLLLRRVAEPDRALAESGDEGRMRLALGVGEPRDERHRPRANGNGVVAADADLDGFCKTELRLPAAD